MTARRELTWTAIPFWKVGGLHVTVLLTPRLFGPDDEGLTLAAFEMDRWPQRVRAQKWKVEFDTDDRPPDTVAARFMREPYQDLARGNLDAMTRAWDALFPADTPVALTGPDADQRPIRSFPLAEVARTVHDTYARAGAGPDGDPPGRGDLRGILVDVSRAAAAGGTELEQLSDHPESYALGQARRFYERPSSEFPDGWRPAAPDLDFERMLTILADHPYVLRYLGLAIDLIPRREVPRGANLVRVVPTWDEQPTVPSEDISPWTRFASAGTGFAATRGAVLDTAGGVLSLRTALQLPNVEAVDWGVVQFDLDGAVLKLLNTARSVDRLAAAIAAGQAPFDTPEPGRASYETEPLAALRSSGVTIAHLGRGAAAETSRARARDLTTKSPGDLRATTFDADDLVRGYRVDVWDAVTGDWHSLCSRCASYTVGPEGLSCEDEGYVKRTSATTGGVPGSPLYIHEAIARWEGWSLVVPRPDRPIRRGESGREEWKRQEPPRMPAGKRDFAFTASASPSPGTLPRLRFGRKYRFRVRLVDLAGSGPLMDEVADDDHATPPITHKRFDPIAPPVLAPAAPYAWGESVHCLVIRSDRGRGVEEYSVNNGFRDHDERHVLPPKTSFHLAERHGAFEAWLGANASDARLQEGWQLARRADATLADIAGARWFDTDTRAALPDTPTHPRGAYVVLPPTDVELPWLPDVPARSWAVTDESRAHRSHRWSGAWPKLHPERLRLVGSSDAADAVEDGPGAITVALPPATDRVVNLSSVPEPADLQQLGIVDWVPQARDLASIGHHWLVTPWVPVRLVHAVQRPLSDPGGELHATRTPGETSVLLTGAVSVDAASTGQIEVFANWIEPLDIPTDEKPCEEPRRVHVASVPVSLLQPDDGPFPSPPTPSPKPGGDAPQAPEVRHELGDTRFRDVTYELVACSRFREYFDPELAPESFSVSRVLDRPTPALSSERPAAPKIVFAVPTFGWQGDDAQPGWTDWSRRRVGGGLRVYLERPWYSSGAGELIAVVLHPGGPPGGEEVRRLVSQVGHDPLRAPDRTPGWLTAGDFAGTALPPDSNVTLAEVGAQVTAVPYAVTFSEARRLWYAVIDIPRLGTDAYGPFVRLALARYQPQSCTDEVKLSPVALSEFLQVPPTRELHATRAARSNDVHITITGQEAARRDWGQSGAAPGQLIHGKSVPNRFEVTVEQYDDAVPGDFGWRAAPAAAVSADAIAAVTELVITVPPGLPRSRLSVRELERYDQDPDESGTPTGERLVYADTLAL